MREPNNDLLIRRYVARQREKQEMQVKLLTALIIGFVYLVFWLAGSAFIAWVLVTVFHHLTFWQWLLVVIAASIIIGRLRKGGAK